MDRSASLRWCLSVSVWGLAACSSPPQVSEGLREVNGTELWVKRMGSGEPILVVHGGPVLEHGYLVSHLAPLAESYELIFFDQRLSGRSAGQVDSATVRLETFVDDIDAVRTALGLDRIHLMAHSWGGLLALRYAIRYGEHLRSLVLLNSMAASAALWREEEQVLASRLTQVDSLERAAVRASEGFAAQEPEAIRQMLVVSFKPQFVERSRAEELELYVPVDYAARSGQFGYMMVDLMNFDYHYDLSTVTVPTLVLYGSNEPGGDIGGAQIHERLPNSEFVTIEGAGHFPFIEQPELFLNEVLRFLDTGA